MERDSNQASNQLALGSNPVTKEARQGERAARFWNEYYKPGTRASPKTEEDINHPDTEDASSDEKNHEWICKPEAIMHILPLQARDGEICRVLEIGCGDSTLAETIYNYNPEHINMLGLDISREAILRMQEKHKHKNGTPRMSVQESCTRSAGLHYEVASILDLSPELCPPSSFNLVIDKGTSDTMQYRAPKDDCKILLSKLFTTIHALLVPGGTYVIISPKYTIKCLRLAASWDVTRIPLELESRDIMLANSSNKGIVYAHVCTKQATGEHDSNTALPCQMEWLVCPGCDRSRESMGLRGEQWRVHRKYCRAVITTTTRGPDDDCHKLMTAST